jgi:hypothetical protein
VFSFSSHKKFIFHFLSVKNGFLCEAPIKNGPPQFLKYDIIFYAQFTNALHGKGFPGTLKK